jgi:uncharacterized protein YbjQ (UPF0145 family)
MAENNFLVLTTDDAPGYKVTSVLGLVKGSTVRSRNVARDIGAGFKTLIGGEIKTYTAMANDARDEALNRMINDAISKGANAVLGMRFSTSMIMQGAAEMVAFGTAVVLK